MSQRLDLYYRTFRIVAAVQVGVPTAAAFSGDHRWFRCEGLDLEAAVLEAKRRIAELLAEERSRRREPHIGTTAEYRRAFQALTIAERHAKMLRAHANAPDRILTAAQLAGSAGYANFEVANAHYGPLGHKVAEYLETDPPRYAKRDEPVWTRALAEDLAVHGALGHWQWRMHDEVASALHELAMA
jgi:hypothetical protein